MRRLTGLVEGLTRILHYVSGALIVGLMLMTVVHILGRWLFNAPVRGSVELTEIGMVAIVFLGLAYAQVQGDHIKVDLFYERLGAGPKAAVRLLVALVSLLVVVAMTWRLAVYTGSLEESGRETSALGIPLYWVGWVAVAGGVIFALGVVASAVRGSAGHRLRGPSAEGGQPAGGAARADAASQTGER